MMDEWYDECRLERDGMGWDGMMGWMDPILKSLCNNDQVSHHCTFTAVRKVLTHMN